MILAQAVTEGIATRFTFLEAPPTWVLLMVVLPLIVGVSWWTYARHEGPRRHVLAALRALSILFVLALLFRPARVEERQEVEPAEVLVLVDGSASMARADAWSEATPERNALAAASALDPQQATRAELAARAVEAQLVPHLAGQDYVLRRATFDETWTAQDEPFTNAETTSGASTHVGAALVGALGANATNHVTAAVVVSDGRSTGGIPIADAARRALAMGVPVHTVLVGDPKLEPGARVELVEAPDSVLAGDEIAVLVDVIGSGLAQTTPRVAPRLEELETPNDDTGRILDESSLELSEAGLRLTLVAPSEPGATASVRHFLVRVPPLAGEARVDDNLVRFSVRVTTEPIRVLYVDGYPRWEYRFLKEFLKRGDLNITVQCYLGSAAIDFPQEASRDLDPLRRLPTDAETLLDDYDVVILGDINPRRIAGNEEDSLAFAEALVAFVEAGGGLAMQAGEFDNPRSFTATPLEALLPVKLDPAGRTGFGASTEPFKPTLEQPSAPHEIVRLEEDLDVNRHLWEDPDGLAGFYWFFPVDRAKAGSEVLLSHPFEENRYGRRPLLVTGHYPAGRTLFLAVDSTWRWNWLYGPTYRQRFWKATLRWLALGRLKSGDRRFQVEPVRSSFGLDERVLVGARILDEDWQGATSPEFEVQWSGPSGEARRALLRLDTDRPGSYAGTLPVERPGPHRVWIEFEGEERTSASFEVTLPSRENADPSPDPAALVELARATGGRALVLGDLADADLLEALFPGGEERREPIEARFVDLWDNFWSLLFLLVTLSSEWILRKREDLP